MATITTPAKLSPVAGFAIVCDHCTSEYNSRTINDDGTYTFVPEGYVVLTTVDDESMYEYIARCYYCNHRDRDQSMCNCH